MPGNQLAESKKSSSISREHYHSLCCQPNVFSHGALELTFKALRYSAPSLALQIQNVMAGNALPSPEPSIQSKFVNIQKIQKHFVVDWPSEKVSKVIRILGDQTPPKLPGDQIIRRALLQDWMYLGRSLMTDEHI